MLVESPRARWIVDIGRRDRPEARLLCVPYAGAGTAAYRQWPASLPEWLEVWAARLPARETRIAEPPVPDIRAVVGTLADQVAEWEPLPYSLYGHSMGALVCFELAREVRRRGLPQPRHLFVSGRRAPQIRDHLPRIHHLPVPEFLEEVRRLNGIPERILAEPGLIDLIVPALRADFAVCETYEHAEESCLDCRISVFGGDRDPTTTREQLEAWRTQTTGDFTLRMYQGDHFFIHTWREELLAAITADLTDQ